MFFFSVNFCFTIQHNVDVSHFDGWKLKKSILNTIFEAVKAITGGITAINGQLIKGSGYAISAGGKVNLTKNIFILLCIIVHECVLS